MFSWIQRIKRKPLSLLGIDVTADILSLLELKKKEGGEEIVRYGSFPISKNTSPSMLLNQTVKAWGITGKKAIIAIPDSCVLTQTIQIEKELNEIEMEERIFFEAEQALSQSLDQINVDFHIKNNGEHSAFLEVLLVAAPKEMIESRVDLIKKAGLSVHAVDVESYAMDRIAANSLPLLAQMPERLRLCYGLALHGFL